MAEQLKTGPHLPDALWDGYEVHATLLAHGLTCALYPRQVLIAHGQDEAHELSFTHGLPESSRLGSVTYSQDKRMRRALLERAELPVPKGGTFSMGRGLKGAYRFASSIGYPVVVKPAVGDNGIETYPNVADPEELDVAIDQLRTPPAQRPDFTRAAYGLTELREPGEKDGRIVVPPGYRFLIEKQAHGQYLRVLVAFGKVLSMVLCERDPSTKRLTAVGEVADVHPSIVQLALKAVRAVPGLSVGSVDIVASDVRESSTSQNAVIVELSERPGLAIQAQISEELSSALAAEMVGEHAEASGVDLGQVHESVTVRWMAEAVPDLHGCVEALTQTAAELGLQDAKFTAADRVEGLVRGELSGDPRAIARISEALLEGTLQGHRAMLVETTSVI